MTSDSSVVSGYAEKRCKVTTIIQNGQIYASKFVVNQVNNGRFQQIHHVTVIFHDNDIRSVPFVVSANKHE